MQALAKFIMRGHVQASLSVIVCTLLSFVFPPFSILSAATVGLYTLRQGEVPGFSVLFAVSLIFAVVSMLSGVGATLISTLLPLFLVFTAVWFLASILRRYRSLALTISIASLLAILCIIGFHLAIDNVVNWWQVKLTQFFSPAIEQISVEKQQNFYQIISIWASQFTGIVATTIVLYSLISLFVARRLQAILYNPGGFQQEFYQLRFGKQLAVVTLVIVGLNFLPVDQIALMSRDALTVVLYCMYLLQGLAVGHAIISHKKLNSVWLVALYVVALISYPLVAVMGFIDTWFDFRKKFINSNQPA